MNRTLLFISAALLSTASWAGIDPYGETDPTYDGKLSDLRQIAVPPAFNAKTDPEAALRDYPLGVIPKLTAFFRHGPPHKRVILTNGDEGWIYEIPHQRTSKRYTLPSGKRVSVQEIPAQAFMHTYTLVICDGVVSDVIYKDDGPGTGVTATEMQAHKAQPAAPGPIP